MVLPKRVLAVIRPHYHTIDKRACHTPFPAKPRTRKRTRHTPTKKKVYQENNLRENPPLVPSPHTWYQHVPKHKVFRALQRIVLRIYIHLRKSPATKPANKRLTVNDSWLRPKASPHRGQQSPRCHAAHHAQHACCPARRPLSPTPPALRNWKAVPLPFREESPPMLDSCPPGVPQFRRSSIFQNK